MAKRKNIHSNKKGGKRKNKNNPSQLAAAETGGNSPPGDSSAPIIKKGKGHVDGYAWVNSYCDQNLKVHYDGRCVFKSKRSDLGRVHSQLLITNHRLQLGVPTTIIEVCLEDYVKRQHDKIKQNTLEQIAFTKASEEVCRWVRATTGHESPLDIAVVQHFIWQVKRKLSDLPVERHMMPILVGKTGSGKTWAIDKLIKPVSDISETGRDLSLFGDDRQWAIFHKNYVVCFDEMSKAQKVDIEALKNTVTAKVKTYRKMKTNLHVAGDMVSTFIGTSNTDVADIIYDPTSARRFWQINSQDKCDWEIINTIDYKALWQSVDEKAESPILPFIEQITEIQNKELRAKNPVEEWFEAQCEITETAEIAAANAYGEFKDYAEWAQLRGKVTLNAFGRALKKIPGVRGKAKNSGTFYNIKVKVVDKNPAFNLPLHVVVGGDKS